MFSEIFIKRPILATVCSIVIIIAGLVSMETLPIAQFPDLVPPQVHVTAIYPGADPDVIAQTVASPLEKQINGVDGMLYMNSVNSGSGAMTLTVTFDLGTDPDLNAINVNNRVQAGLSSLPEEVRRLGVRVNKNSPNMVLLLALSSPSGTYDTIYLSNYALINVVDNLKRIKGVSDAVIFGAKDYAMRIWIKPDVLSSFNLTVTDIAQAISEQNSQFSLGRLGQYPTNEPLEQTFMITTKGRMTEAAEFENIIIRANAGGGVLYLKDVARVELGSAEYNFFGTLNKNPTIPIGIMLAPGANAIDIADKVVAAMDRLSENFPEGVEYSVPYDTTTFVRISIEEVIKTFVEAMLLVFLVVFIFLQNWRATLIPCLAVPVSIIGTFAGMKLLGFTINTMTLFGMVLAIGIVVDDAIIVLENVYRHMDKGLGPKEAAVKAMEEMSGPVVAIVLVLCAVFIPVGFLGGLTGVLYKQFAITIAVSVAISGFVALTLTPALCGVMLKPVTGSKWIFFKKFDEAFESLTGAYSNGVRYMLRHTFLVLGLVCVLFFALYGLFKITPTALVPDEDQGIVMAAIMLPDGASLGRAEAVTKTYSDIIGKNNLVRDNVVFTGYNFLAGAMQSNYGFSFVTLKDWKERAAPGQSSFDFVKQVMAQTWGIADGFVFVFNPPPIMGMSTTGGFEAYLQYRGSGGVSELAKGVQEFLEIARKRPELAGLNTTFSASVPKLYAQLDRGQAKAMGVRIADIFAAMSSIYSRYYVNDFDKLGRTFQVLIQGEASYRNRKEDLRYVFVRSENGDMVPLNALVKLEHTTGPEILERYNLFPAAKIMGNPALGYTSGQVIAVMDELIRELPQDFTLSWTGSYYQETQTGSTTMLAFGLGIVMVFLILAAQYEKWSLPIAVVAAVPFGIFGAILATFLRGLSNDLYFQVALLTMIGLASKNAILIVEFAVEAHEKEKMPIAEAAAHAAHMRFRPIIMTSLAFILGCVPLAVSSGAGSASRHAIGTAVIGGMIAATALAIFFIPSFFEMVMRFSARKSE